MTNAVDILIVFEPTSTYSRRLETLCRTKHISCCQLNPRVIPHLRQVGRGRSKTDSTDAELLYRYGIKRGHSSEQVCVLVARDRGGATVNHVLSEFSKDTLVNVLQPVLAEDTLLCSDGHPVYKAFAADRGVVHKVVNVSAGIRVVEKVFHIQNVNAYHSRFKTWIRRFNGVATKYLPNYLGWYRWLDGNANALNPQAWFLTAVGSS